MHIRDINTIEGDLDRDVFYVQNRKLQSVYSIIKNLSKFYKLIKRGRANDNELEQLKIQLDEISKLKEYEIGLEYLRKMNSVEVFRTAKLCSDYRLL